MVAADEWYAKPEAALWARQDDVVVVARPDALRSLGMAASLERAQEAGRRGADAVLVVGLREPPDVARAAEEVGVPLVVLVEESGLLSGIPPAQFGQLGVALAVCPGTVPYAAAWAARDALRVLRNQGTSEQFHPTMVTPQEWDRMLGMDHALDLERRFPVHPGTD